MTAIKSSLEKCTSVEELSQFIKDAKVVTEGRFNVRKVQVITPKGKKSYHVAQISFKCGSLCEKLLSSSELSQTDKTVVLGIYDKCKQFRTEIETSVEVERVLRDRKESQQRQINDQFRRVAAALGGNRGFDRNAALARLAIQFQIPPNDTPDGPNN